jgi:hypothetical protein
MGKFENDQNPSIRDDATHREDDQYPYHALACTVDEGHNRDKKKLA